jgi:hypothetical protein
MPHLEKVATWLRIFTEKQEERCPHGYAGEVRSVIGLQCPFVDA